jgi:hypothetical protein
VTTRRDPRYVYATTWGSAQPTNFTTNAAGVTIGQKFRFAVAGFIVGARYFRDASDGGHHLAWVRVGRSDRWLSVARCYVRTAAAQGPFGWEVAYFRPRVKVVPGTVYELCLWFENGINYYTPSVMQTVPLTVGDITLPADSPADYQGQLDTSTHLDPNFASLGDRYGIDVLYWKP